MQLISRGRRLNNRFYRVAQDVAGVRRDIARLTQQAQVEVNFTSVGQGTNLSPQLGYQLCRGVLVGEYHD